MTALIPEPMKPEEIPRFRAEAIKRRKKRNKILEGWDSKQMRNYLYLVLELGGLEQDYAELNEYLDVIDAWIENEHINFRSLWVWKG